MLVVSNTLVFWLNEYFIELNQAKFKFLNQFLNWIFRGKRLLNNFLIEYSWKKWYWIIPWIEFYREMNEWIIFWIDICHFWWKVPLLSNLDTFWEIFGHFSYSTSINDFLTNELNYILNWILGKVILNRILNESIFGKIQTFHLISHPGVSLWKEWVFFSKKPLYLNI